MRPGSFWLADSNKATKWKKEGQKNKRNIFTGGEIVFGVVLYWEGMITKPKKQKKFHFLWFLSCLSFKQEILPCGKSLKNHVRITRDSKKEKKWNKEKRKITSSTGLVKSCKVQIKKNAQYWLQEESIFYGTSCATVSCIRLLNMRQHREAAQESVLRLFPFTGKSQQLGPIEYAYHQLIPEEVCSTLHCLFCGSFLEHLYNINHFTLRSQRSLNIHWFEEGWGGG